ncbi:MAG: ATP-binding cassette domain-containing protein, partial [Pirellulaceae bacterium]
ASHVLGLFVITEGLHHFPAQVSGGVQHRVAMARAIAKQPDILLCDEPTGALDLQTGITVLETLQTVNQQLGTLTVVITHNASIAQMATRVISMRDGRIVDCRRNDQPVAPTQLNW